MKFSVSLKKNYEFRRLYAKGRSAQTPRMVLYCRKNWSDKNRFGITVSTKIGKAVYRNRIRRRFREIYRLNEGKLCPGYDIIIVAKGKSRYSDYKQLNEDFVFLAEKLGVWSEI